MPPRCGGAGTGHSRRSSFPTGSGCLRTANSGVQVSPFVQDRSLMLGNASGGAGGGSAILITSDVTGDLSQSYGMPAGLQLSVSDMDYATTHYGINLMRLRSTRSRARSASNRSMRI